MISMLLLFLIRIVYRELMFIARTRKTFDYHGFSIDRIQNSETSLFGIFFNVIDFATGVMILYYFYYFQSMTSHMSTIYYITDNSSIFRGESPSSYSILTSNLVTNNSFNTPVIKTLLTHEFGMS